MTVGILFSRRQLAFWDGVAVTLGLLFFLLFLLLLWLPHRGRRRTNSEEETGLYRYLRHPEYTGIIMMNLSFLLVFRTGWLLPVVLLFGWLWGRAARREDAAMAARDGDGYRNYMARTGSIFPRLFPARRKTVERRQE
ncbi:MAG: isoprenylcysteine carboxylmethyltransferase family protein [Chloroflexota bacterium]